MTISPAPRSVLRNFQFNDIDEFRSVRALDVRFTPLARRISARQTMLSLPGCDINLITSFPRLTDAQLMQNCTAVAFMMDERRSLVINGIGADLAYFAVGHGGAGYMTAEQAEVQFASMMFTPEVRDRGWPDPGRDFSVFMTTGAAQQTLRGLVSGVLEFAAASPDELNVPGVSDGIRESLLAAVDHAFASLVRPIPIGSQHTARFLKIVRRVEEVISSNLQNPVYSSEVARELGVSVRTLHNAVLEHRGISLHRYLRLKRLWLVRQRLCEGDVSIKACALAHGFWHLGEFSRSYRMQFGEPPSATLARAR